MLALHICNNKIKQSLNKFFFITFSLSTELLEDKQRFKLEELIRLQRIYISKHCCPCFGL